MKYILIWASLNKVSYYCDSNELCPASNICYVHVDKQMMKVTAHVTELEQKVNVLEHKRFSISHKNDGLRIDIEDLEERITDW